MKHTHTETEEVNFSKLEQRIMAINDPKIGNYNEIKQLLKEITTGNNPVLIAATGGSKVIAYYLQLIVERLGNICEVIEPRDYFYKENLNCFSSIIAISASGNTNGINEILNDFQGNKYLICENKKEANYKVISWGTDLYEKEKSFISLATSLGPMTLLLDAANSRNLELIPSEIIKTNEKIKELMCRSKNKIDSLIADFKDISLIQILSGYETRTSCSVLESNLVEVGLSAPVIHDKGSFCHGRSNLLFRYPNSKMIYLTHGIRELDELLIKTINSEYPNILVFNTDDLEANIFWKEYYLILQMYFLSKKIADDKKIDLTQPDYNPEIVRKLYRFKGEM